MIATIQKKIRQTDSAIAAVYLKLFREKDALRPFMFHSLFRGESEIQKNHINPLQRTTVHQLRQLVEYYVRHGYRFLAPEDIAQGLDATGKYAVLTFDDGYFNNTLALPVLEEFNVPATFFISTNHILQNKCYWWDVVYRESLRRGMSDDQVYAETDTLKDLTADAIEDEVRTRFGMDAFKPISDIDRPFTPKELKVFSQHRCVRIGNHTANHAILTNHAVDEMRRQVTQCQDALEEMTGKRPISIAYPNGNHDEQVLKVCSEVGIRVGFTVRPHKTSLPLPADSPQMMRLGRFCPEGETSRMLTECRMFRSDLQLYDLFRAGYVKFVTGRPS